MSYTPYDTFSRSISRGPSIGGYGAGRVNYPGPYDQQGGMYNDPLLYGENYPQPSYSMYGSSAHLASARMSHHHLPGTAYDDSYYMDDRPMSTGVYPPVVQQSMSLPRHRRHSYSSSMPYTTRQPLMNGYHGLSSILIKFKRKGAFTAGITLGEAQSNVRLSGNDSYTFHDLNVDPRGRLFMRVTWPGYTPLTYEIPVDGYGGRVDLQTLARRVARAVVHFLQANVVPIHWDRVELHHLEEVSPGTWQPVLTTH